MAERDVVVEFSRMFQKVVRLLDTEVEAKDLKEYLGSFCDANGEPYIANSLYSHCETTGEILESLRPQYIHFMHLYLLQEIVEHYGIDESKQLVQQYDEKFPRSVPLMHLPHPLSEEEIEACHGVQQMKIALDRDPGKFNVRDLEFLEKALGSTIGVSQLAFVYCNWVHGSLVLTFLISEACARGFTDTADPRFLHLFEEAMKEGYIDAEIVKCLFIGAAGAGKTNTIYLLFGWPPPPDQERHSTGCINSIRAISCIKISSGGKVWEKVDSAKLHSLLAGDILDKPEAKHTSGKSAHTSKTGAAVAREMRRGILEGEKLRERKWIYLIDSGGQPQFHQVVSAFLKNTTAGIFVLDLSEELSDHPLMELFDHGAKCGESCRSPLTHEQIFRSCIQTIQSFPYTTGEGRPLTEEHKSPKIFAIGTHRDKEKPGTRARKNEQLLRILVPTEGCKESCFHSNLVYSNLQKKEVIHAINARSREKHDTDIAEQLRNKIEHLDPLKVRIPRRWYGLELEIELFAADTNREIVTLDECVELGERLHVPPNEVRAALVHLGDLNIFLYYPDILPEIVFTNPSVLLNKIRRLVQKSYDLKGLKPSGKAHECIEGKWSPFCDRGIITRDTLSDTQVDEHLTSQQLFQLFEHILIVARISDTEFFMPALLDHCKPEEIVRPSTEYASAYIISFPDGYAPCGLSSALIACLCSPKHNPYPWVFTTTSNSQKLYGNCITFSIPNIIGCATLIDSGSYFEVYVDIQTQPSQCSREYESTCPKVRKIIADCLKKATVYRNCRGVKYNETILCQCKEIPRRIEPTRIDPHPAILLKETSPSRWKCPLDPAVGASLVERELVWFQEPKVAPVPLSGPDVVEYLKRIRSNEDLLLIGERLGLDRNKLRRSVNHDTFIYDLVGDWLQRTHVVDEIGKPSWSVLIKVLRKVGQNGLANDIEEAELKKTS